MKKISTLILFLFTSLVYSQCIFTTSIVANDTTLCYGDTAWISYPAPDSITITSPPINNNGQDGNMFDVTATNTIRIKYFEGNIANTPNPTTQYYIYYKVGTHVGFETNAAAWTMIAGPLNFNPNAPNSYTRIPFEINLIIPAGQTYAFYLSNTSAISNNNRYHNGTATGTVLVSNPDLTVYEGTGGAYPFGTFFNARPWEGNIIYDYPTTFLWNTGSTNQTIQVNPMVSTMYSCTSTNSVGCIVQDSVMIEVNGPIVNLGSDTSLCEGQAINLDAGNPGDTYLWSNGSTSQTISVDTAGVQSVMVMNSIGCSYEDSISISINALPTVGYSISPNDTVCIGTPVTLSGTGANFYSWTSSILDGVSFTADSSYTYILTGTDTNGCTNTAIADIVATEVFVYLGPDIIQPSPTTLDAGVGFVSYLWNTGETTQTINAPASGLYFVTVTDINGCSGSDTIMVFYTIGILNADESETSIEVYPNPSNGIFNMSIKNLVSEGVHINIIDLQGRIVKSENYVYINGEYSNLYDISSLDSGIYILTIFSNEFNKTIRFIKK